MQYRIFRQNKVHNFAGGCELGRAEVCQSGGIISRISGTFLVLLLSFVATTVAHALDCTSGKVPTSDNSACECPFGEIENARGICVATERGCQGNEQVITVAEDLPICGEPLPEISHAYSADACTNAGWTSRLDIDSGNYIAELCLIRFSIITAPPQGSARTLGETAPLQLEPGDDGDGCIIRQHNSYQNNADFPSCEELFGANGGAFPLASSYTSNERLRVAPGNPSLVLPSQNSGDNGSDNISSGAVISAIGGLGFVTWLIVGGDPLALNFTPHAEIHHNDGVNYYAYGSKMDYVADNWTGYWQAAQIGDNDKSDWIYGAGTKWTGEVFSASMKNTTRGMNSDTEFSLSARTIWNVWTVESAYVADWDVRELNDTWENRLSLGASTVYEKWTMTPKAELSWQAAENIGKTARFRFDLSRDL